MPRLMHIADLHLGWRPRDLASDIAHQIRVERDDLLRQAVDVALEQGVQLLLIAGDLFEHHEPDARTVAYALTQLQRLHAAGIGIVTVPGNHDELTYAQSVYRTEAERWPGVLVTRPEPGPVTTLDVGGARVGISGVAYVGGVTPTHEPIASLPHANADIHIGVMHGTWSSAAQRPGDPFSSGRSLPIDAAAMARSGYHYLALGHLHVPQQIRLQGVGWAVYPGCVGGKGPRDVGSNHWTLIDVDSHNVRVHTHPAQVAPVWQRDLDVGAFDDANALEAAIVSLGDARTWARISLRGSLAFALDLERVRERAAVAFRHLELEDRTHDVAGAWMATWAAQPTVRGAFVRRMQWLLSEASEPAEREKIVRALRLGLAALAGDR